MTGPTASLATSLGSCGGPSARFGPDGVVTFQVVNDEAPMPELQLLATQSLWDLALVVCEEVLERHRPGDSDIFDHL